MTSTLWWEMQPQMFCGVHEDLSPSSPLWVGQSAILPVFVVGLRMVACGCLLSRPLPKWKILFDELPVGSSGDGVHCRTHSGSLYQGHLHVE
jgi:hypothetical protein